MTNIKNKKTLTLSIDSGRVLLYNRYITNKEMI